MLTHKQAYSLHTLTTPVFKLLRFDVIGTRWKCTSDGREVNVLLKSAHRHTDATRAVFDAVPVAVGVTHMYNCDTAAGNQIEMRFTLMVSKQPCSSARTVTMSSMQPESDKQHRRVSLAHVSSLFSRVTATFLLTQG